MDDFIRLFRGGSDDAQAESHDTRLERRNAEVMAARREAEQQMSEYQAELDSEALANALERLGTLEASNADLQRRIAGLEMQLSITPMLDEGKLPPKADITQLWCQVFHSPDLTPKQRKTKTEWSLRLTVWVRYKRAKKEINVRLFPGHQFYRQVMARPTLPKTTDEWATALRDDDRVLAGMLTATTQGQGRPFIASQFCVLNGHLDETSEVDLVIDDDVIAFKTYRPAAGTAKWFLDWHA